MNPTFITVVSVFLCSISVSSGSFGIEPATVNPNRPDHCYKKDTNEYYKNGESWPIAGCGIASCVKITSSSGNTQMMISYESCGSVGYEPPCYTEEAKDASYPDCCPEVVCPDSEEETNLSDDEEMNNEIDAWVPNRRNETELRDANKRHTQSNDNDLVSERQWRNLDKQENLQSLDSSDFQSEENYLSRKPSPRLFYLY